MKSKLGLNVEMLAGELIGTFVLVFLGISSVALSVLFNLLNLYQIAFVWMLAVVFGVYSSRKLSHSHLNPAVSVGFLILKQIGSKEFLACLLGQFIGSIAAGITVFFIFKNDIEIYENVNSIIRDGSNSQKSAMIFGEYFPNPGNVSLSRLSVVSAMLFEGLGTLVLMLVILVLTHTKKVNPKFVPTLIGVTVGLLIIVVAPYTQAGFNPFRDLGPRLVSYFMGWKNTAFNLPNFSFFTVYILAPIIGSVIGTLLFKSFVIKILSLEKKLNDYER
jgi:glycerol uptake facilitator protein